VVAHVSVVIPTCNRPHLLDECLTSVAIAIKCAGRSDIEVVVNDDSGNDESQRLVLAKHTHVSWAPGPRRGPASNRNAAVLRARGHWIFFLDDDCIARPDWIRAFLAAIACNPDYSVFEGKTVADRERERLDEEAPVNAVGGYLWSCNMAIRRALFEQLGGFCESFPHAAMEDVDLRLRIQALGARFPFVANAVVCHPYRRVKGLQFSIKHGRSYIHLVTLHPELVARARWGTWLGNAVRRSKSLLFDAFRYNFRGFSYGVMSLSIGIYFDFMARLRTLGSRASS
jgi:GT2 family glycosyltransferase